MRKGDTMLKATVRIECEGGFPERFLNEATACGVQLWDVTRREVSLWCSCNAADYRALRAAAKRASVRMRVKERHGVWFRVYPYRRRAGLVLGLALFVLLLHGLSSRIWIIRVQGNERVSEQAIREVLEPLGVREGASFASVDLPQVQLTALERLPELTWLTVNVTGSTATVQVTERTPTPPLSAAEPANVVAARDGVIVKVDAVSGQAMVKPGDAVTAGTLLISGVMDSKIGPLVKHADGVVTARTTRSLSVTVPFAEEVASQNPYTVSRPSLYVLSLRLPLYADSRVEDGYTVLVDRHPLFANGNALPVGIEVVRLVYATTELRTRSPEGARAEAAARLDAQERQWGEAVQIEEKQVTVTETADGVTLSATYTCLEPIGVEQPLQIYEKTR